MDVKINFFSIFMMSSYIKLVCLAGIEEPRPLYAVFFSGQSKKLELEHFVAIYEQLPPSYENDSYPGLTPWVHQQKSFQTDF